MKITVPVSVLATDTDARTISGRIVTWGETGNTSAGKTIFAKDSIALKPVKLFIDHNMDKPIGKVLDFETTDLGIEATFKIANTQRGNDAIVEAMEGLKDGFSVGIKLTEYDNTDEGLVVKMSNLVEVSLVETPAIDSARVSEVAASDDPTHETKGSDMTDTPELQTEHEVSVEAAKVEAAKPTSAPVFTAPRVDTNVTAGQYVHAQIKAQRGDNDARDLVAALEIATVTENTGMVPPNYLRDIIGIIDASRPFVDSIERAALPPSGMKIFSPVLGAQASVAETAEGAEFDSTDTAVTFQEDNIVKFAGANIINIELLDRSQDNPDFLDLLLRELAASYARATDVYALQSAIGGAAISSGATIYQAIVDGIADSYNVMKFTPNKLMVPATGGTQGVDFPSILGAEDGNDRPLFGAVNSQNSAGTVFGSTAGTVAGLELVVDSNVPLSNSGEKFALVYPSAALRFHESGTIQLRSNIVANGRVEIGVYGYAAVVNRYPTAVRALSVA
jgi:HK97 family phage prohead protease